MVEDMGKKIPKCFSGMKKENEEYFLDSVEEMIWMIIKGGSGRKGLLL
jgi:hypothetical protein